MQDSALAIRKLAAEVGLHDVMHAGELARIFDGRGRRLRYLRRSGVSLDGFAELLYDRGITPERVDLHGVYELLDRSFDATGGLPVRAARKRGGRKAAVRQIENDAARAKRNRLRKSVCVECGAIGYSSAAVTLEHCGVPMQRVDRTFSEVMEQVAACEIAPF